jgi:hypothetical protein
MAEVSDHAAQTIAAECDWTDSSSLHGAEPFGYPRPQLRRNLWIPLNGPWHFALDVQAVWRKPREVRWDGTIEVPYSPETERSGIHQTGFFRACWYRRTLTVPPIPEGERLLLHFGAVDHEATVWLDDTVVIEAQRWLHAVLGRHHRFLGAWSGA